MRRQHARAVASGDATRRPTSHARSYLQTTIMSTTIQHTVSFRYKSSASADEISKASKAFYHLKETCVREVDSKPLISRISGGKQTSPEGLDQGMNVSTRDMISSVLTR